MPDGYTMVIFGVNQIISAELTNPTNDMFRDFAPVSQVAAAPFASAGRSAYACGAGQVGESAQADRDYGAVMPSAFSSSIASSMHVTP